MCGARHRGYRCPAAGQPRSAIRSSWLTAFTFVPRAAAGLSHGGDTCSVPTRLDTVRGAYETLRQRGGLAILAGTLFAPDVELDFSALPDGRVLRGVDALRDFRRESPWTGGVSVDPEELIEVGPDRVLALVRLRSVAPAMGAEVEGRFAHLITFRGERVVRWQLFTDRAQALRAAGLPGE